MVTNSLETSSSSLFHSRKDGGAAESGKHKGTVFLWDFPFYGVQPHLVNVQEVFLSAVPPPG